MAVLTPAVVFRYFETEGIPDSGAHDPIKAEIIELLDRMDAASGAGLVARSTLAELNTITPTDPNAAGWVLNDPDPTKNGTYVRSGGAWVFTRSFPDTCAVFTQTGGTGNALVVTTAVGIDPADIVLAILVATTTNAAGAVTLAISGAPPVPLLSASGAPLGAGEIQAGRVTLIGKVGTQWRVVVQAVATWAYRGTWNSATAYVPNDLVQQGGSLWLAKRNNTNVTPVEGADWTLFMPGGSVADGTITTAKLADGAVTTAKLAAGAVTRPILAPYLSKSVAPTVEEFAGSATVGDGVTDATPAFTAALASGTTDLILSETSTYRITAPIVLSQAGFSLTSRSWGGYNNPTILADFQGDAAIKVQARSVQLAGFTLNSGPARYGVYDNSANHGILIGGTAGLLSTLHLERLTITRQPGNGIHSNRTGANSVFDSVQCQYNRGHGFFFDDGTYDGLTKIRPGLIAMYNCRSAGDGGNALRACVQGGNFSIYRLNLIQFEAYDSAWNTALADYTNFIMDTMSQNFYHRNCAFGDVGYQLTAQPNGDARLAKAQRARSVNLRTNSSNYFSENVRDVDVAGALTAGNDIEGIWINDAYASLLMADGYIIGTGCTGVHIRIADPSMFTRIVVSQSTGGKLIAGDSEQVIIGTSGVGQFEPRGVAAYTIVSDSAQARAGTVLLTGQGNAADNLQVLVFSGSIVPPDGTVVRLLNLNAYAITVKNSPAGAANNIYTKSGADVVLNQNRGMSVVRNGTFWHEV